jgi:hypothetical protein
MMVSAHFLPVKTSKASYGSSSDITRGDGLSGHRLRGGRVAARVPSLLRKNLSFQISVKL